jgi:hypothetical protein
VDAALPEFADNKGVSLVLVNSEKGMELFNGIAGDVAFRQAAVEKAVQFQANLKSRRWSYSRREEFWRDYHAHGFEYCVNKFAPLWKVALKSLVNRTLLREPRVKTLAKNIYRGIKGIKGF